MRATLITTLLLISVLQAVAQKASFIYIQGDKKTPFYVKHGGEMMPRYGKNYCIIPELTAGVANIEVLFQQNAFPAQKFAIRVPDGGERGFLLMEKEGEISLYDLEQEFYLLAGNAVSEDHLPQRGEPVVASAQTSPAVPTTRPAAEPAARQERHTPKDSRSATTREKTFRPRTTPQPTRPVENSSEPRFIPNLSLDTNGSRAADGGNSRGGCGEPLSVQTFAALYRKALDIDEQDERLLFLNKQTEGCYSPTQLRLLARVLDRDAARFTFLKKVQSRVTVTSRFAELEDVLTSEAYRARFRELVAQP
jgi:hypothetical protein